jgi:hypothetical protein
MRQPAKTFQDLIVWQKAHQFVLSQIKGLRPQPKHVAPVSVGA